MAHQLPDDSVGGADERPIHSAERSLGDFTTTAAVLRLVPLALIIGVAAAGAALALLDLIGLVTNLVYHGRADPTLSPPLPSHLGALAVLIPVGGGLVVGLMARYGSERIRGHGIPEAMESILVHGSTVEPRLAVLKPLSSAISIGTGGPFGAEGPIIMTGGALGSIFAQLFELSSAERRALLVAGAAAGMAAVFGTPVAAALLGVELLAFELKPRSLVPIGVAVVVADAFRALFVHLHLMRAAPLFPVPGHGELGGLVLIEAAAVGVAGGLLAWLLTRAVYAAEDAFRKLPIHWMWWPAIGGLVVGLAGLVDPRALGVGYATIGAELGGHLVVSALLLLLVVKLVAWAVALGSGTSGGILAPLLMMGAALGGSLAPALHGAPPPVWALIGMAATMAGVMRSPLTSVLFAFELTHDVGSLAALLVASIVAHLVSVLTLRRSILTEKVARRGFHVLREYSVDPLEAIFVREVMLTEIMTVAPEEPLSEMAEVLETARPRRQRLYPVVDNAGRLAGALPLSMVASSNRSVAVLPLSVGDVAQAVVAVAHPDDTLRVAADRMAASKVGELPVVGSNGQVCGVLTQFDLLRARERQLEEERHRHQVLSVRRLSPAVALRLKARTDDEDGEEDEDEGAGA